MIIIEGLDGTGKTTLVNDLLKKNYILVKQDFHHESHYHKYVNVIRSSHNHSVSDRSFISEMVYGKILANTTKLSEEEFDNLIKLYSEYKTRIIYLYASKDILLKRRKDDIQDREVIFHLYQKLMDEFERRLDYISSYMDVLAINTGENNRELVLSIIFK